MLRAIDPKFGAIGPNLGAIALRFRSNYEFPINLAGIYPR